MSLILPFGFSQNRVVFTENFNGSGSSFTCSPQSAWMIDTLLSVSGKAAWGFVPNSEGDSIELISPMYDLGKYAYAYLRFSHICKVSDSDLVTVEFKENYMGSDWKPLPYQDYRGGSVVFRRQRCFHHGCYTDWMKEDPDARPVGASHLRQIKDDPPGFRQGAGHGGAKRLRTLRSQLS